MMQKIDARNLAYNNEYDSQHQMSKESRSEGFANRLFVSFAYFKSKKSGSG